MNINGITLSSGGGGGGIHIPTPPVSGRIYSLRVNGTSVNTSVTAPNGMRLMPFYPINRITAGSFSINVTVATATATVKILIFSNLNGNPDTKLFESADLSCVSTGIKTVDARGLSFNAGTIYWIGIIASASGPTLSAFATNSMLPISESAVASTSNFFLGTTSYSYNSVPTNVVGTSFFPASSNCPAVWITAL
jgi:hypothetical protein